MYELSRGFDKAIKPTLQDFDLVGEVDGCRSEGGGVESSFLETYRAIGVMCQM